jgi:hypothetical protein
MRCESADFIVARSVVGCNKPGYKVATHPVASEHMIALAKREAFI